MKPFWLRRHTSCPDCGYVYYGCTWAAAVTRNRKGDAVSITCPRCKAHYTMDDFYELSRSKYSTESEG